MTTPAEFSREFLEEFFTEARKQAPGWFHATVHQRAKARAGGRGRHRTDEPTVLEKLALVEIRPANLREVSDTELRSVWRRLNQWFAEFKRRRQPIENVVNAALFALDEMRKRSIRVSDSTLTEAVERFRAMRKERGLAGRFEKLPTDLVVIRDFVTVVGSTAKGKENPADLDLLVRAPRSDDGVVVGVEHVWLPIRNVLDPDKKDLLSFVFNAQGAHGDNVPLFDLVLRKKPEYRVDIVKDLGEGIIVEIEKAARIDVERRATKMRKAVDGWLDRFRGQRVGVFRRTGRAVAALAKKAVDDLKAIFLDNGRKQVERSAKQAAALLGTRVAFTAADTKRIDKALGARAKMVARESADVAQGIIRDAKVEGASKTETTRRLREAELLSTERAFRISRTESTMQVNMGLQEAFKAADIKKHRWITKKDPQVRDSHANLEGQVREVGEPFGNGLLFPGDPGGDPSETINCRCVVVPFGRGSGAFTKGFPNQRAEVGIHVHNLERENKRTKKDGIHRHLYKFPDGDVLWTEEDGEHTHELERTTSDTIDTLTGEHRHKLVLQDGTEVWTENDGPHRHQLQAWSTAFDGIHIHKLKLSDGRVIENLWPGEYWVDRGRPPQADVPKAPGAESLARLAKQGEPAFCDRDSDEYDAVRCQKWRVEQVPKAKTTVVKIATGPVDAPVAFVGASLGRIEVARREPFVGPTGETLRDKYLAPLGLGRDDVVLANVVPVLLTDDQGRTREPYDDEVRVHKAELFGELDRLAPKIVVALGQTAKRALGDRADMAMPHPTAVRRLGDSGEVARKVRALGERLAKQRRAVGEEGAESTRGAAAQRNWARNWHEFLPPSGKGRFVYQHHWRGLERDRDGVDETKLSDRQLLATDNSLHGDIRFEGPDGLFGWAVFIGAAKDNAKLPGGDKLIAGKRGEVDLRLAPKLQQPKEWLDIGKGKGDVFAPGEPGSTPTSYSKLFVLDTGTYRLGVAQRNSIEVFLDGGKLKGRYILTFPMLRPGDRVWLIDKPEDQTPRAERENLADEIGELRRKGRKFLFWAKPGERPRKIDVRTGREVAKEAIPIAKADPVKRIVYGIVMDPYGKDGPQADAHDDWTPPGEIEKAAHGFMKGPRVIGMQHRKKAKAEVVENFVEQYPTPDDYQRALRNEPHKVSVKRFGTDMLHSGAWVMGVELGEVEWKAFLDGEINAFSPGGMGVRTPMRRVDMPRVTFIELVEKPQAG